MISIQELERLIEPYETSGWGGSDGFGNTYQEYRRGEATSRLDTAKWFFARRPQEIYRNELVRVITELGISLTGSQNSDN